MNKIVKKSLHDEFGLGRRISDAFVIRLPKGNAVHEIHKPWIKKHQQGIKEATKTNE